jgi:hypothetical protein
VAEENAAASIILMKKVEAKGSGLSGVWLASLDACGLSV